MTHNIVEGGCYPGVMLPDLGARVNRECMCGCSDNQDWHVMTDWLNPKPLVLRAPVTHILNPETRKQILMDSLCRSRVYWHCMATPERLPDCPYCWAIALRRLLR